MRALMTESITDTYSIACTYRRQFYTPSRYIEIFLSCFIFRYVDAQEINTEMTKMNIAEKT